MGSVVRVHGEDAVTAPFIVDSYAPLTADAVAYLLGKSGGALPLAWGRYTDADLTRDFDVAAKHGIPVMLIARRSSRVPHAWAGEPDGKADRARVDALVAQAVAAGASVLRSVFLDVEMEPTMAAGYWRGWSAAFDGGQCVPCCYMPNRDYWPRSWLALEADVAAGARCGGTWVALYRQPSDGSAVFRDEPWERRPKASDHVPYLAWQAIGNAYQQRYDFSVVNPAAMDWLADTLGPAPVPRNIGPAELPRASSTTPDLRDALAPMPERDYSEVP